LVRRQGWSLTFVVLAVLMFAAPVSEAGPPASHFLDCHGVKIHYVVQGAGEPVILIHGLYSSASINWQLTGIFSELAKDHQVMLSIFRGTDVPISQKMTRPMAWRFSTTLWPCSITCTSNGLTWWGIRWAE
jgi:hypothetical protein